MLDFMHFVGVDGRARLVAHEDVRLIEDLEDGSGMTITLCDGTQFDADGSVENILLAQRGT
jgi:hypothetical protein